MQRECFEHTRDYMIDGVVETLSSRRLLSRDAHAPVLLMVSGGSDSTAMCLAALELSRRGVIERDALAILHVNHNLRGEASDLDEAFVRSLSSQLGIAFESSSIDVSSRVEELGGSVENAARIMRYEIANGLLDELCADAGVDACDGRIWVAHTKDDRVETFFMRTIVGTGPGGLSSIPYSNARIVRPLLDCTRQQLRDFIAAQSNLGSYEPILLGDSATAGRFSDMAATGHWREDATNFETDGFRAYVRNELVPVAKRCNPNLIDTMCRTIDAISDEDAMLCEQVDSILARSLVDDGGAIASASLAELASTPLPIRRRGVSTLCKMALPVQERIERKHIDAIASALQDDDFSIDLPGNVRASIHAGIIRFIDVSSSEQSEMSKALGAGIGLAIPGSARICSNLEIVCETIELPDGDPIEFTKRNSSPRCAFFSLDAMLEACGSGGPTLVVTNRAQGDAIRPLGMGGRSKLLSDAMIDAKVDAAKRDEMIVVRAGDSIAWVVGLVQDDGFKVDSNGTLLRIRVVEK